MVAGPGSRYAAVMFGNIGTGEIVLLLLLALLLFGAKRLPEIGRSVGHGMREFKDSVTGATKEIDEVRAELETPLHSSPTETTVSAASREHDSV
jgi:sec-independent protein translocase protein TatA